MHFNVTEIVLQVIGYVIAGTIIALIIAAIQNVWVWHSKGNRGLGRPHAVLAVVIVLLIVLMLETLDPYGLV
jgi:H+/Cl- antiporter ClcA